MIYLFTSTNEHFTYFHFYNYEDGLYYIVVISNENSNHLYCFLNKNGTASITTEFEYHITNHVFLPYIKDSQKLLKRCECFLIEKIIEKL